MARRIHLITRSALCCSSEISTSTLRKPSTSHNSAISSSTNCLSDSAPAFERGPKESGSIRKVEATSDVIAMLKKRIKASPYRSTMASDKSEILLKKTDSQGIWKPAYVSDLSSFDRFAAIFVFRRCRRNIMDLPQPLGPTRSTFPGFSNSAAHQLGV